MKLKDKKIAILATDGFEQIELTRPMEAVENEGAEVHIVSLDSGVIQGVNGADPGDTFPVNKTIAEVNAGDYHGLILPGGLRNPDTLRMNNPAVDFVRDFFKQHKPVSAICHAPWLLIEADVVKDRTLTSWPSLQTDLRNAEANWVDQEVVVDEGLTTSRKPGDLDAFCAKTVEEMCEGKHAEQTP